MVRSKLIKVFTNFVSWGASEVHKNQESRLEPTAADGRTEANGKK